MKALSPHHSLSGFGLLVMAQIAVGINIVGSKYLVTTLPILILITGRFLLATLLLLPMHWISPHRKISVGQHFKSLDRNAWLVLIAQALCAGTLFNFLMVWGLRYTDAQSAGIITSTLPAIIAVASWLVLKEKFTLKKSLCVAFATLGLIVISIKHRGTSATHSSFLGALLVFISLLPEATYYVLVKLQTKRLPIFLMSATINAINVIVLFPLILWQVNWHSIYFSFFDFMILIIIGLSSGIFYVFWNLGADKVDSILASLATVIMPIATVVIASITLGETITIYHLVGMSLAVFSIIAYAV